MGCNAYRRLWKPTPGTAMLQPTGCCRAVPTSPSPLPCAVPPLTAPPMPLPSWALQVTNAFHQCERNEKKRKDYAFLRQCDEKPSIIPGCAGLLEPPSRLCLGKHGALCQVAQEHESI